MQLSANPQTDWYQISFGQWQQSRANPCAPGYALSVINGAFGSPEAVYMCRRVADAPIAAPVQQAAPTTVNVNPQITTQVSPQISPAFQQQFQPSNSPATAGTSQTAPMVAASPTSTSVTPASTGITRADLEAALVAQANAQAERYAQQAALMPATSMPDSRYSSPVISQPDIQAGAIIPALPNQSELTPVSASVALPKKDYTPIIAALIGAGALLYANSRKGKNNVSR